MDTFFKEKSEEMITCRFSDPERAFHLCRKIKEHGFQTQNEYEVAYAYLYMGDTMFSLGKIQDELDYLNQGEKIQIENGYDELLIKNYNITGIIYMTLEEELIALEYYLKAVKVSKRSDNYILQGMLYNNIGALLYNLGDEVDAAEYFEKGYRLAKKQGLEDNEIAYNEKQFCINMYGKYIKEGNYQKAKEMLDTVEEKYADCPKMLITEINVWTAYARIYHCLGEVEKTKEFVKKFEDLTQNELQDIEGFGDFEDIVELLLEMEEFGLAYRILKAIWDGCEKNELLSRKLGVCRLWIQYYKAQNDLDALNTYYKIYFELKQKLNKENNENIITAINNRYKLEREKNLNEALSKNNLELIRKSEIDDLTGIYNRNGLSKKFQKWRRIALENQQKICFGIMDIDYFKNYNDYFGHLAGDECLKHIAHILRETAGDDLTVARYGGDEFVIFGFGKTREQLEDFLKRLFEQVKKAEISFLIHPDSQFVTISLGMINGIITKELALETFIHMADRVLYTVKKKGKNNFMLEEFEQ